MKLLIATVIALTAALHAAEWEKTILRTEKAEVTIVPEIGRIMQFGFIGKPGVFWNAPELLDKPTEPARTEWQNFGGEKVWPAPENDWKHFSSRERWLPPAGFDATPTTLSDTSATSTTITWPDDEKSGIRMSRKLSLTDSTLTVTTTWKRLKAGPSPLAIWTIAQFKHPEECFIEKAPDGLLPPGIIQLSKSLPPSLRELSRSYALTRDAKSAFKVGTAGSNMAWADSETICHVRIAPSKGTIQPDAGSRVQIYTNADEKPYVELETLGSLATIPIGSEVSETTTYTLHPRDPAKDLEATIETLFTSN